MLIKSNSAVKKNKFKVKPLKTEFLIFLDSFYNDVFFPSFCVHVLTAGGWPIENCHSAKEFGKSTLIVPYLE